MCTLSGFFAGRLFSYLEVQIAGQIKGKKGGRGQGRNMDGVV